MRKITGNHVPPQIGQAPIWGAGTLVEKILRQTTEELPENVNKYVGATGGV